jgi:hypothetical protein
MPGTPYTGVAASGNLAAAVTITVPADGDNDAAATFDVGLQRLADYLEAIRSRATTTLTAITPASPWVKSTDLAYFKDASNIVHMRGFVSFIAGASTGSVLTLPVGFRPLSTRYNSIPIVVSTGNDVKKCAALISPSGAISFVVESGYTLVAADLFGLDCLTFLAEQ